ncbi:unnamed protein product [Fraxinus pennsylvanica]|uniref:Uncharacterized protein n=1 Tax=Fraxinus pennsylvanica TaxID=56036 RepID=A0AAD2A6W4_9LAMI|nr:unnamed protein product [Fraxinus pennsylvanica]
MCFWMKRELDVLQIENRELKRELEELKVGHLARNSGNARGSIECLKGKGMPPVESPSSEFKQSRSKKSCKGEENGNGKKVLKRNGTQPVIWRMSCRELLRPLLLHES